VRRVLIIVAALGLLASACSSDSPLADSPLADGPLADGPTDSPSGSTSTTSAPVVIDLGDQQIVLTSSLSGFGSCDALLEHLRTTGAEHVGPYGFNSGYGYGGPIAFAKGAPVADFARAGGAPEATFAASVDPTPDDTAASAPQAAGGSDVNLVEGVDFSGTNVQESGVDEADIVKTDGRRIYVVSSGQLVVVDVATRSVLGQVEVAAGSIAELFVSGDEIIYITNGWSEGPYRVDAVLEGDLSTTESGIAVDEPAPRIAEGAPVPYFNSPKTTITRISIAANGVPSIGETLEVPGDYVSSRAVDGTARIVLRSNPQNQFPFVYPAGPAGEKRAEEANRGALLDSQLSDWLPSYTLFDRTGQEVSTGILPGCDRTQAPTEFAGFGVISVLTIPIDGPIDPSNTAAVLAPGETVYASTDSLYVTTTRWFDDTEVGDEALWPQVWDARQTSIHRFDTTSTAGAVYMASGSVPGDIHNQFALSEFDGYLRVVSSTGQPWDNTSQSTLHVLEIGPQSLEEIGSVGDMGNGEAVQSVRFDGSTGYVVTFRQVDPFYTLDISDPTDPKVVGELKIPGFSSYLHPIGDGMVIGVGTAADTDGRTTGAKVSLFDVTNLADPLEVATWAAPDGWNNIGWDHRSFLWWGAEDIAVVPVTLWSENWSGAVVLKVADGSITEMGRIDHIDDGFVPGSTDCAEIDPADVSSPGQGGYDSELSYIVSEGSTKVLLCESSDEGGASGFQCEADPWFQSEAAKVGIDLTDGQRIEVCWPVGNEVHQIARTMMLPGGELWSLSTMYGDLSGQQPARLQVNDLVSLDRLAMLDL